MKVDTATLVRHPYVGEVPPALMAGFEAWKIDTDWQWVLVYDGKVVAQLLTSNMHGMLYMIRISSLPEAPKGWALRLFRAVIREVRDRGLIGYMVLLCDDTKAQLRLMRIVQRHGGYLEPICGVLAAGRLELNY